MAAFYFYELLAVSANTLIAADVAARPGQAAKKRSAPSPRHDRTVTGGSPTSGGIESPRTNGGPV
jgi:hypothetical protein